MKFSTATTAHTSFYCDALLIGISSEACATLLSAQSSAASGACAAARQMKESKFSGKSGQLMTYFADSSFATHRVIYFGMGEAASYSQETLRKGLNLALREAKSIGADHVAFSSTALLESMSSTSAGVQLGQTVAEYAQLIDYTINHYKTEKGGHKPDFHFKELTVLASEVQEAGIKEGLAQGKAIGEAVNKARDLTNLPACDLTPSELAKIARKVAADSDGKIKVKIYKGKKALTELGAHALLAVAQGSAEPAALIELIYSPATAKSTEILGLVGKSVTFDTGGLDLKTAPGMRTMKRDMSGGAVVLAAIEAIARLDLPVNVRAVLAATENGTDAKSMRPGDIIKTMKGLTVEIDNTDAEGRLTLADGIEYVKRQGATSIVDLATLTGAIRSFGADVGAGAFGNTKALTARVLSAAEEVGERLGELPMWEEFRKCNHTPMADLKNSGGDPGAITAAWFIREFAGDTPWVHLDIAGASYRERELGPDPKGATGYGVRTLIALARNF